MKKVLLLSLVTFILTGCATIISGSKQDIRITSNPANATVFDNGMNIGNTPMMAKLSRKNEHLIRIELDGYAPYEMLITKKFNAWYIGNILFGGIIGLVVDPITGAIHRLSPEEIDRTFTKMPAVSSEKKKEVELFINLEKEPEGELIGQLEKLQ